MKTAGKPKGVRKRVRKTNPKRLVDKAIQNIESKLDTDEVKGSYGDLIRLLQIRKELEAEEPRDVQVKWVEDKSSE